LYFQLDDKHDDNAADNLAIKSERIHDRTGKKWRRRLVDAEHH
jgi:hypothetical protein